MYATAVVGILYSVYVLSVLTLMSGFVYALTSDKKINLRFKIPITIWIVFLITSVVAFHTFIHIKFPWTRWQISSKQIIPKK